MPLPASRSGGPGFADAVEPGAGETGPPTSYSTQSNSTGQFTMKDIEPGKYRLTVNRNGHVCDQGAHPG